MGFWLFFSYGFVFINGDTVVHVLFPFYDAERGIRTLKNDTVRASLNRMRMPISPSPQGEMTIWIVVNYDSYRLSAVKLTI